MLDQLYQKFKADPSPENLNSLMRSLLEHQANFKPEKPKVSKSSSVPKVLKSRLNRLEEAIALQNLFEATGYKIEKLYCNQEDLCCWKIKHIESGDVAGLWFNPAHGWSCEVLKYGEELSDNFPSDVLEFAVMNDVEIEA